MTQQNKSNDRYRIRRERIAIRIDRLHELDNHLAADDPSRAQILDQIAAAHATGQYSVIESGNNCEDDLLLRFR